MSKQTITNYGGGWIVQRDPDYTEGLHPYHETRFITTANCNLSGFGDNEGVIICSMRDSVDHKANAQAIAAVPDMIAALQHAIPWLAKILADGSHLKCAMPRAAEVAYEMANAALRKSGQID